MPAAITLAPQIDPTAAMKIKPPINGWLIVFEVWLCLGMLGSLGEALQLYDAVITHTLEGASIPPAGVAVCLIFMTMNFALLAGASWVVYCVFTRSPLTLQSVRWFLWSLIAVRIVTFAFLTGLAPSKYAETLGMLIGGVGICAVWLLYFAKSVSVRQAVGPRQ